MRMIFRMLFCAGLLALGTGASLPACAQTESPMFRGDPRHRGAFDTAPVRRLGGVRWRFETDGPIRSSPAVVGGLAYFGSGDGRLYAVDAATGRERWRFETGGAVPSSPAVAMGTVYFTSRDRKVYALGAADGRLRWAYETGPELPYEWAFDYFTSSPAVVDGVVYVGSGDGHVYALDAVAGGVKWKYRATGRVRSSPAVDGGVVYVGDVEGRLHALDAATGEARWVFETEGARLDPARFGYDRKALISSPTVTDDVVVVGGRDGFLYAVGRVDGRERWRVDHQISWVISSPAVDGNTVYTGTSDGQFVQAVDLGTGAERWRTRVRGTAWPSPVVAGGMVYIGSSGGSFYALDAATGERRWIFRAGSSFHATPVVLDGVVYAGNDDGTLYALTDGDVTGTPPLDLQAAVYWEESPALAWFPGGRDVFLRDAFAEDGFEVVGRDSLARFMRARIEDGRPSVVVFVSHFVPPTVLEDSSETSLFRRYLTRGRVVWLAPPPLAWVRDPATEEAQALDFSVVERVLGIRYPGPDTRGMGGLYGVRATAEGLRWGLPRWWLGNSAVDVDQVTTVLALDENGRAGAWLKNFGGPPGTGLLQLWVNRDFPENVDALRNAVGLGL